MPEKEKTEAATIEAAPDTKPAKGELRAALVRSKIAAGLTKEQAENVVAGQEEWDAHLAKPKK